MKEQKLILETCFDCYENSVVVPHDHEGSAYCTDCMTNERLKVQCPEIYEQAKEYFNWIKAVESYKGLTKKQK